MLPPLESPQKNFMIDLGFTYDCPETLDCPAESKILYPTFYIDKFPKDLPNDLKVGEAFEAKIKLKITSITKGEKQTSVSFEVLALGLEESKQEGNSIKDYL